MPRASTSHSRTRGATPPSERIQALRAQGKCTRCGERDAARADDGRVLTQCRRCLDLVNARRTVQPSDRAPAVSRPFFVCCQSASRHRAGCVEGFDTSDVPMTREDAELLGLEVDDRDEDE